MQHLEGSGTSVLYIGRKALKVYSLYVILHHNNNVSFHYVLI
jgi:hypothetical protein